MAILVHSIKAMGMRVRCSCKTLSIMASNYPVDYYSEYSSSSDSDHDEEDLARQWRRTYPGATNSYIGPPLPPESVRSLSMLPAPVNFASDSQLSSRFARVSLEAAIESLGRNGRVVELGKERAPEILGKDLIAKDLYCKAYKKFTGQVKNLVSTYQFLDPAQSRQFVKGNKFDLDSSGMVMLQGGLINALASWEEFIVEILKEGFLTFVEVGSGSPPTLHSLKKSLPSCDIILRKELRHSCQVRPADEMMFNLMWGINAPPEYASRVSPWAEHFESYCQSTISGSQLVPVFSPGAQNSIDSLFSRLFQVTAESTSLSENILNIGRFRYKLQLNQDDEIELQIHSVTALRNISRLYYALRCIFAHGHNQKTITGALKDFPRNVSEFELGNERAAKYYLGLYRRMEKYGRDTSISYLTFINMIEFLKRAAFFLMRALAKWVYDTTDNCIWSYKPHN